MTARIAQSNPTALVGLGKVLVAVYGVLALAASGRSFVQIATNFAYAPLAYVFSATSAVVYLVATVALFKSKGLWRYVAWVAICFELIGVIAVGTLSVFDPILFPSDTVWSYFGRGYLFVPLVLPILGIIWLAKSKHLAKVSTGNGLGT